MKPIIILTILLFSFNMIWSQSDGLEMDDTGIYYTPSVELRYLDSEGKTLIIRNTSVENVLGFPNKIGQIRHISYRHYFENSDSLVMLIDEGGRMTRPKTNNSDLLPIAYGSVCKDSFSGDPISVYDDTGNFTITEGAGYIDIHFNENIAGDVVLSVSPVSCAIGGVSATQSLQTVMNATTIRVHMYMADGSVAGNDKGFSFVAYMR